MLESLHSLFACAVIWTSVLGIGRPIVRCLKLAPVHGHHAYLWPAAVGLALFGWVFTALAALGMLGPTLVGILTLAAGFWGIGELFCVICRPNAGRKSLVGLEPNFIWVRKPGRRVPFDANAALVLVAVMSTLSMLVAALAPTLSPAALEQTLAPAKALAEAHAARGNEQWLTWSLAPAWFYWALVLDGPIAAGTLQWTLGLLAAAATAQLGQELLGTRRSTTAALFLLVPAVQYQLAAPLVDLGAMAFGCLGAVALTRALIQGKLAGEADRSRAQWRWFAMAGFMLLTCAALAPRWTLPLLASAAVYEICRRIAPTQWWGQHAALAMCGLAIGVVGTQTICGAAPLDQQALSAFGVGLTALLVASIVVQSPHASPPLWAGLLAGLAVAGFTGSGATWWYVLLPAAVMLAAQCWLQLLALPAQPRRVAFAVLAVTFVAGLRFPAAAAWEACAVAVGREQRDDYVLRHNPEFAALLLANQIVPADARLLSTDPLATYVHCHTAKPAALEAEALSAKSALPASLERLQARGVTHVLLAQPATGELPACVAPIAAALDAPCEKEHVLPLADIRLTREDASVWRYRLIQLR